MFAKGGLNLSNLSEEVQIEAAGNYRICECRDSSDDAKPKRQRRKPADNDVDE